MDTAWALQNRPPPNETSVVQRPASVVRPHETVRHFDPYGDRQPAMPPVSTWTIITLLEMRRGDVGRFEKLSSIMINQHD